MRGRPARSRAASEYRVVAGRRVGRREREHHLVGLEIVALAARHVRPRRVLVLLGDRDVDRAAGEQRQRLLGLDLDQLDAQARMRAASRSIAGSTSARAAVWKAATRTVPRTSPGGAASSASTSSTRASSSPARATSVRPASVSSSRRPALRNSSTPLSRWSWESCWETADGVNESASAARAIVPWAANSRRTARRRGSSIVAVSLNDSGEGKHRLF